VRDGESHYDRVVLRVGMKLEVRIDIRAPERDGHHRVNSFGACF
jgi:hypothetical protein